MASTRQLGLRLDGKVSNADEQRAFLDSVERGWYELRSGHGEVVAENDGFWDSVRKEIRK